MGLIKKGGSGDKLDAILILAVIGLGVGFFALNQALRYTSVYNKIQKGFVSCTITALPSCTKQIVFSPSFSSKPFPTIHLNVTCGANCSSSATVSVSLPNIAWIDTLKFQAVNTTVWINMPTTDTELYGFPNQRLQFTLPSGLTNPFGQLCVDFTSPVVSPQLTVQYSTDLSTWHYLLINGGTTDYSFGTSTGTFVCSFIDSLTISVNTLYYFRVVGNDGFGPTNDGFGNIELILTGQLTQSSIGVSIACLPDLTVGPSTTSMTVGVTCGNLAISGSKTFTIDWSAGLVS